MLITGAATAMATEAEMVAAAAIRVIIPVQGKVDTTSSPAVAKRTLEAVTPRVAHHRHITRAEVVRRRRRHQGRAEAMEVDMPLRPMVHLHTHTAPLLAVALHMVDATVLAMLGTVAGIAVTLVATVLTAVVVMQAEIAVMVAGHLRLVVLTVHHHRRKPLEVRILHLQQQHLVVCLITSVLIQAGTVVATAGQRTSKLEHRLMAVGLRLRGVAVAAMVVADADICLAQ